MENELITPDGKPVVMLRTDKSVQRFILKHYGNPEQVDFLRIISVGLSLTPLTAEDVIDLTMMARLQRSAKVHGMVVQYQID